jgi:carbon-monoxide dehydrogenase iron sulfur subunit
MSDKNKKIFCDIRKCLGCGTCEIACAVEHSASKELALAIKEKERPLKRRRAQFIDAGVSISSGCNHCEDAACVNACISGAMYKDRDNGLTKHDTEKCIGCWMCIMSCPFGAITRKKEEKIAVKCDMCPGRDVPACVSACPAGALFFGTYEDFENNIKNNVVIQKGWV